MYKHDIGNWFGAGAAEKQDFSRLLDKSAAILKRFAEGAEPKVTALFDVAAREDDLEAIRKEAQEIRQNFRNIVVLGTGGSSLSGQALAAIKGNNNAAEINLCFADNIDPHSFSAMLAGIDIERSFFLTISKSGDTLETIAQFLICFDYVAKAVGREKAARHFLIITMPKESSMAALGEQYGIRQLAHETEIGGRFSIFTNVGLLPGAIIGLDIRGLRKGAVRIIRDISRNPAESEVAKGMAVNLAMMAQGFCNSVYMHYLDRLRGFVNWHRQIWAESLGKNGNGTTPIRAAGTLDQHSQLQLYLGGPKDKFFTFLFLGKPENGNPAINPELINRQELEYLKGKSLGEIMLAEQRATLETLVRHGAPVRSFALDNLQEETMGALFMHFMLETIGVGIALGINPFDQPAVEESKVIARKLLGEK